MLDNIKLQTYHQEIIKRVYLHPDFISCKPRMNFYHTFCHKDFGVNLSFDFRKAFENGKLIGYRSVDVNINPHYHFNQYRHNGNDLTPRNCIKSISEILEYIGIKLDESDNLKVINLEFGINVIPETDVKEIVNGLHGSMRTIFMVNDREKKPFFKTAKGSSYKIIKAYAKGIQCHEVLNAPEIDINTFRFEVKTKQAKRIKPFGIETAKDLLKEKIYPRLGQELINEWQNVLLINLTPDLKGLKRDDVQFITQAKNFEFWDNIKAEKHRNTFGINKAKYYKLLKGKNNLHHRIKAQIIDKIFCLLNCANSTRKTPIKRENRTEIKGTVNKINLENAQSTTVDRRCIITGLDISMQKPNSKYLCSAGLKWHYDVDAETYRKLKMEFLKRDKWNLEPERQFYYIAHNIRNKYTNKIHNHNSFRRRNYNHQQLQITEFY